MPKHTNYSKIIPSIISAGLTRAESTSMTGSLLLPGIGPSHSESIIRILVLLARVCIRAYARARGHMPIISIYLSRIIPVYLSRIIPLCLSTPIIPKLF